jgi:hypothetical protein
VKRFLTLAQAPFWILVYGLMVWLPAAGLTSRAEAKRPAWWAYGAAVLLPFLFAAPAAGLVGFLHPIPIHFPPIPPNS